MYLHTVYVTVNTFLELHQLLLPEKFGIMQAKGNNKKFEKKHACDSFKQRCLSDACDAHKHFRTILLQVYHLL